MLYKIIMLFDTKEKRRLAYDDMSNAIEKLPDDSFKSKLAIVMSKEKIYQLYIACVVEGLDDNPLKEHIKKHMKDTIGYAQHVQNDMFSVGFYYDSDNDFTDPLYERLTEYRESAKVVDHRIF